MNRTREWRSGDKRIRSKNLHIHIIETCVSRPNNTSLTIHYEHKRSSIHFYLYELVVKWIYFCNWIDTLHLVLICTHVTTHSYTNTRICGYFIIGFWVLLLIGCIKFEFQLYSKRNWNETTTTAVAAASASITGYVNQTESHIDYVKACCAHSLSFHPLTRSVTLPFSRSGSGSSKSIWNMLHSWKITNTIFIFSHSISPVCWYADASQTV